MVTCIFCRKKYPKAPNTALPLSVVKYSAAIYSSYQLTTVQYDDVLKGKHHKAPNPALRLSVVKYSPATSLLLKLNDISPILALIGLFLAGFKHTSSSWAQLVAPNPVI